MTKSVLTERRGDVLLIGLNRPEKRNAFNLQMIDELAEAYRRLAVETDLRCGVLYGVGDHFTAGLDLPNVVSRIADDSQPQLMADKAIDPWASRAEQRCPKPVVAAIHGFCMTLGIELALAADVVVVAKDAHIAQLEVSRGIYPFGGAAVRWPLAIGYQNAMRWLLTGDPLDAETAYRIGLAQEIVEIGQHLDRAVELARRIAQQAPLGVAQTLATARLAQIDHNEALVGQYAAFRGLLETEDAKVGVASFLSRSRPSFRGV